MELPLQMEIALSSTIQHDMSILRSYSGTSNVVVAGMGGSGIIGDLLSAVVAGNCPVPVSVCKSYNLPAYVGDHTFLIVISFSGNTEETIEVMRSAHRRGAKMMAISSGGTVAELAAGWGIPWFNVDSTIPQPRAAIGALFVPLYVAMEVVGLVSNATDSLKDAISHLKRRVGQVNEPGGIAMVDSAAKLIAGRIPLIWGSDGIGAVAASRLRTQINENAKSIAISSTVPELCHNELAGWGQLGDITRQLVAVVAMRHIDESEAIIKRYDFLREVVSESVGGIIELYAEGDTVTARMFDLIFLGDLISLEVARIEQIDPGPVPVLDRMKRYLEESKEHR